MQHSLSTVLFNFIYLYFFYYYSFNSFKIKNFLEYATLCCKREGLLYGTYSCFIVSMSLGVWVHRCAGRCQTFRVCHALYTQVKFSCQFIFLAVIVMKRLFSQNVENQCLGLLLWRVVWGRFGTRQLKPRTSFTPTRRDTRESEISVTHSIQLVPALAFTAYLA